jgi:hypothetical protein
MKSILQFKLPEEENELKDALDGSKFKNIISNLDAFCRNELKYNEKLSELEISIYEIIREKIRLYCDKFEVEFE